MITLETKKTIKIQFMGVDVIVEYRIPTAAETEVKLKGSDIKDSDIFKEFVISAKSPEIEGWADGVTAETVLKSPGTYKMVNEVAMAIVKSAYLLPDEKN